MALPLVGALPAIISGIGTAVAFIIKFFKDKIVWFLLKLPSFMAIIFINGILFVFLVLYYGAIIKILLDVYGFIDQFLDYLTFKNTNSEIANMVRDMLGASLFFQALNDSLNIFKLVVSSVFISFAYFVGTKALLSFRKSILSLVITTI
ncbi:hypothetical protein [Campylobacter corcagiensis]|uniref:Uncharacterized protein n=1 Tax=Campylobacter corcagiensis TaxID=1448857 RepID=A0A7M1LG67_9BACT|nr:hypothetical protein [Campylobacter corcagiensis]QKF64224.1 putative membrane protein [Campylobacter corcagiensis]QOQ87582.1 hypothetical protein IMC76_01870 [Campylobacter corcagiensis]